MLNKFVKGDDTMQVSREQLLHIANLAHLKLKDEEVDTYLFGQGTHYEIYNKMGAHKAVKNGVEGVYFSVWAPKAKEVYVVGEFNDWNAYGYDMKPVSDGGVYDLFIPSIL